MVTKKLPEEVKTSRKYMRLSIACAIKYTRDSDVVNDNDTDRKEAYRLTQEALNLASTDVKTVSDADYVLEELLGIHDDSLLVKAKNAFNDTQKKIYEQLLD